MAIAQAVHDTPDSTAGAAALSAQAVADLVTSRTAIAECGDAAAIVKATTVEMAR